MKILLQHPHAPHEISGVVTFVRNTQKLLVKSGVEVRVLSTATASPDEIKEAVEWADIVHFSSNHARMFLWAKIKNKPIILHYHYPFWGTWKETAADRNLGFFGCWGQSLRVFWNHGKGWRFTGKFAVYFMSHWGRTLLRVLLCCTANARITCSEFIRNDSKIPWPMAVIPYGFNFDELAAWREKPFPKTATFCFIGRITPTKGLPCLLDAAGLLKKENTPLHLHVIGDGDSLEDSKRQAKELELNNDVTFYGRLEWDAALPILSDCAVLVVPSDYDDAAPYVIIEGCALKRALIGSHRGGIPEQVGPGLIFQAGDHRGLADKMRLLAKDMSYTQELGEKGYQFALKRSGNADGLLEIYRKLTRQ